MHRADADVVRAVRGVDLLARMGREPDQHLRAHELAHLLDRHVVLSDVDSVGPRFAGDERIVVDDEQGSQPAT